MRQHTLPKNKNDLFTVTIYIAQIPQLGCVAKYEIGYSAKHFTCLIVGETTHLFTVEHLKSSLVAILKIRRVLYIHMPWGWPLAVALTTGRWTTQFAWGQRSKHQHIT